MRDKRLGALYLFYFTYFLTLGMLSLAPRYYLEIGLNDLQIGTLTSVPSLIAMCLMPVWGTASDRVKGKRIILTVALGGAAIACFFINSTFSFFPLLIAMTCCCAFQQPAMPVATAISLEYASSVGRNFGPIRMIGTVGYQLSVLLAGAIFVSSFRGLYAFVGVVYLLCMALTATLPPIAGHQHGRKKVPMSALLKNSRVRWLLLMVLIGTTTSMFYMSFFTAHLGKLGVSNSATAVIAFLSVLLELPVLLFAERIMKRFTIWQWLLIGYVLNGVRWLGLALAQNVILILICQIPAVSVLACFEFFPQLYINRIASAELTGGAQSALNLTSFGVARVVGSLLGGVISNQIGIQPVFGINGVLLLAAAAALIVPCRRLSRADAEAGI